MAHQEQNKKCQSYWAEELNQSVGLSAQLEIRRGTPERRMPQSLEWTLLTPQVLTDSLNYGWTG